MTKPFANLFAAKSAHELAPRSSSNMSDEELAHAIQERGLVLNLDGYIQWHPQNPDHPRNWTSSRKAYNTPVILLLEFITSAAGTAGVSIPKEQPVSARD
ncbi:hypothetical protein LTR50_006861 [Elasticomyces elasticus]|nr:hypothetical protein LTR50_006861 [Elasticomyces elasticus]